MQEVVLFVEEERDSQVTNLFFRVLCCRDEVDSFEVAKIDIPPKDVDIKKLPAKFSKWNGGNGVKSLVTYLADILLLMIPV